MTAEPDVLELPWAIKPLRPWEDQSEVTRDYISSCSRSLHLGRWMNDGCCVVFILRVVSWNYSSLLPYVCIPHIPDASSQGHYIHLEGCRPTFSHLELGA